ncbi:MAG TPA: glutamate decarboxylase [Solirubrobacteraceae bacterium]|jgi:glutamate decarboxylase|nr:glutamate decarboxylase [Solirubrobacteraceae bacterium]
MHKVQTDRDELHAPTYSARSFSREIPKFEVPDEGLDAEVAYQLVHDELNLDGNPALNLASFVTSWMEPAADRLAVETLNKNMIDQDEYPRTEVIHERVVTMLGRLFHAPADRTPVGTATIGSSEAIMLALLAHKRSWQRRREAAGLPADHPNLVVGADVHTCWEKFARYFEVEARVAPMSEGSFTLSASDVAARIDDRTIAVGGLLGTTFTGQMDELGQINDVLAETRERRGWSIPLHIDAASGGFVIPFSQPDLAWDFRLSEVRSINVSNHKFGLVYPGMGTVIFRDRSDLPAELVFHINYLGGDMPNYSLNFSRPSTSVVLQYFNFLRLGRAGYERIVACVLENAQALAARLDGTRRFEVINDGSIFPIVAVRASKPEELDLPQLSRRLRERGWIVPAYTLPADAEHVTVLRMVIKESFSRDMVDLLADDIETAITELCSPFPLPPAGPPVPPTALPERPIC